MLCKYDRSDRVGEGDGGMGLDTAAADGVDEAKGREAGDSAGSTAVAMATDEDGVAVGDLAPAAAVAAVTVGDFLRP